jgi:putative ABC transport system ATP-binding protein
MDTELGGAAPIAEPKGARVPDGAVGQVAARIDHGVKLYGKGDLAVRALDDVTAEFRHGEFTAIMGPSGSGKSTLLHCMAGLDRLTSGSVRIGDIELETLHDKAMTLMRRDHIGFIFQSFNLVPTLSARENILLPLTLGGRQPDEEWFSHVVEVLNISSRLAHRPSELSGGQQQRVATARALVTKPDLLFADEPTGNLDSKAAVELLEQIRHAVDDFGQSVLLVTHDPKAASFSDRVLFLADGRIVKELVQPTTDSILDAQHTLGA